jgi:dienelactone hydrolase
MLAKIIFIFSLLGILSTPAGAEKINFNSTMKDAAGRPIVLSGNLSKPNGTGRFPTVVLLHGCAGPDSLTDEWQRRLTSWNYVVLTLNSFEPRGIVNICSDGTAVSPVARAQDAMDAASLLAQKRYVDKARIFLLGWSHGGWSGLYAASDLKLHLQSRRVFRAVVAFYPYCDEFLSGFHIPVLILAGGRDRWCPPVLCEKMIARGNAAEKVTLKIYPSAAHAFDYPGMDMQYMGHMLKHHPQAAADAAKRVKAFLSSLW